MKNIIDSRWEGQHGIGRFAVEVGRRLKGFERIALSGTPSDALDAVRLSRYLRSKKPNLFFSPGYNAPLGAPCPFVFCVHDLNHIAFKESSTALKRAYYRHVMKPALHRAQIVLTVSEFARRAICEWANLADSHVCNVGNGVSDAFVPATPGPDCQERPYFLYVGNHKPHKNFGRLLEAFANSNLARNYSLVSTGFKTPVLQQIIDRLKLSDRVSFVGHVTDQELASLYQRATALVMVSLYEGFGLPLLEAMSCGTPVITSTLASMPEVAGDAALQVDPYDVGTISQALIKIASDQELRQRLGLLGIERARLFSWDITAKRVNDAIAASM